MTRWLLLAYPRAWRRRYGDEIAQLVADSGLTPAAAVDLIRAGLSERGKAIKSLVNGGEVMVIGPAWRHPRPLALIALALLAPTLVFVAGSVLAYNLDVAGLRVPMESVNAVLNGSRVLDLALVVSPALALLVALAPLVKFEMRDGGGSREAVIGLRLKAANVLVAAAALAIGAMLVWHIVVESVLEAGA